MLDPHEKKEKRKHAMHKPFEKHKTMKSKVE